MKIAFACARDFNADIKALFEDTFKYRESSIFGGSHSSVVGGQSDVSKRPASTEENVKMS